MRDGRKGERREGRRRLEKKWKGGRRDGRKEMMKGRKGGRRDVDREGGKFAFPGLL